MEITNKLVIPDGRTDSLTGFLIIMAVAFIVYIIIDIRMEKKRTALVKEAKEMLKIDGDETLDE